MIVSPGCLMPRLTTLKPLLVRIMSTRFFPMSWTSPFTVASTIVPFCCAPAFFSIFGSRYATACFITPAESSTDGNCILRAPNSSPTVRIPSSSTVLIMSSGEYCPSAESSNCSSDCLCSPAPTDFSPLRIARRRITMNQLPRQFHFFLRNLIQRINFRVVDDGHIQAVVHRLVHEHAVQHAPRIRIQPERNVADAENGLHVRQFLLDPPDCLERLHSRRAVLFLPRRYRQRQRIENQIHAADSILLRRQLVNPLRNRDLFICRE